MQFLLPKNVSNFFSENKKYYNRQLLTSFLITALSTDKVIFSKNEEAFQTDITLNANEKEFGIFYTSGNVENLKSIHFHSTYGRRRIGELEETYRKNCTKIEECAAILHQSKLNTEYVKIKLGAAITKLHEELQKLPKQIIEIKTKRFLGPAIHTLHGFLGNNLKTK